MNASGWPFCFINKNAQFSPDLKLNSIRMKQQQQKSVAFLNSCENNEHAEIFTKVKQSETFNQFITTHIQSNKRQGYKTMLFFPTSFRLLFINYFQLLHKRWQRKIRKNRLGWMFYRFGEFTITVHLIWFPFHLESAFCLFDHFFLLWKFLFGSFSWIILYYVWI